MFNNIRGKKKDSLVGIQKSGSNQEGSREGGMRHPHHFQRQPMSELDVSESYVQLPSEIPRITRDDPKNLKSNKRRLPFLGRRKKPQSGQRSSKSQMESESDDEGEDVVSYEDVSLEHRTHSIEHNSLNPVMLAELRNLKQANEGLKVDESYNGRVDYITKNYRRPPPYPGYDQAADANDGSPSMIQQLLLDQRNLAISKDNASMLNYCPVERSAGLSNEDLSRIMRLVPRDRNDLLTAGDFGAIPRDRLVQCTNDRSRRTSGTEAPSSANSATKQLPQDHLDQSPYTVNVVVDGDFQGRYKQGSLSEVFPRDYEGRVPPPDYRDVVYGDNASRDSLLSSRHSPTSSLSDRLDSSQASGQQASYVPPSPYLNAEIPDWLQVYSKASVDLDEYLKWDMFRYPELDCWQTMLKRLYKKELEQIVLWFEEYRQALQKEIERRSLALGQRGPRQSSSVVNRMKKTEV